MLEVEIDPGDTTSNLANDLIDVSELRHVPSPDIASSSLRFTTISTPTMPKAPSTRGRARARGGKASNNEPKPKPSPAIANTKDL